MNFSYEAINPSKYYKQLKSQKEYQGEIINDSSAPKIIIHCLHSLSRLDCSTLVLVVPIRHKPYI